MRVPLSLRIARLLLFAAGVFALGLVVYIGAQSQDLLGAWPWVALLLLNAAGFLVSAWLIGRDRRRAKLLAIGSAIGMAALGTITGFGAGMLSFPAAGVGALGAWAALLHPPRRRMLVAFVAYTAIGVAIVGPGALLFPLLLPTVFIWPARVLLFTPASIVSIYLFLGIAASVALLAFVPRRDAQPARPLVWALVFGIAVIAGVTAVIVFQLIAMLRTDTSARFELDQLVLAIVFLGGAFGALGVVTLRLRPGVPSAVALGLGAALLFMTFTYRPAITCRPNGTGQSLPLSWALRSAFEVRGSSFSSSGSSGTSVGGGSGDVSTGRFRSGDREATFRCEGDRLVEYREVR